MKTILIDDDGIDIVEKFLDANRVPKIEEVKLFLSKEKDLRYRMIWLLMFCAGMRPYEITQLSTNNIIVDPYTNEFVGLKYRVAKAKVKKHKDGTLYKEVKIKTIYKDSYARKKFGISGDVGDYVFIEFENYFNAFKLCFKEKKMFNIDTSTIRKAFTLRRKAMINIVGGEGFADLITDSCKGAINKRYRIEPYSGRRFFLTFYHYVIAGQDIVKTQRRIGHSFEKDTFTYVHTKESIGFNPEKHLGFNVLVDTIPIEQKTLSNYI